MGGIERERRELRIENRALQALLVLTLGILSWLLISMFDRLGADLGNLAKSVEDLEDENKERDSKLAALVLNIESRLATLEARSD